MPPLIPLAPAQDGKLRLLYEAAPMGFLMEQAGGLALTGPPRARARAHILFVRARARARAQGVLSLPAEQAWRPCACARVHTGLRLPSRYPPSPR